MPFQPNRLRHVVALASAAEVMHQLEEAPSSDGPSSPRLPPLPPCYGPEFVTPSEAERDLHDRDPRIQRYARTLLGLHAETERRGDMGGRVGYNGHML